MIQTSVKMNLRPYLFQALKALQNRGIHRLREVLSCKHGGE